MKKLNHGGNHLTSKRQEQLTVIEYFLKTLKIPFGKTKGEGSNYNSDFNEKMTQAAVDKKTGRYKSLKNAALWKLYS